MTQLDGALLRGTSLVTFLARVRIVLLELLEVATQKNGSPNMAYYLGAPLTARPSFLFIFEK